MWTNIWPCDYNAAPSKFSDTYSFQKSVVGLFWKLPFLITHSELSSRALCGFGPINHHLRQLPSAPADCLWRSKVKLGKCFHYEALLPELLESDQVRIKSGKWPEACVTVGLCQSLILILEKCVWHANGSISSWIVWLPPCLHFRSIPCTV